MLKLTNMVASYGSVQVLHDSQMEVPTGGVVTVLGPNGAGKSTLIKGIAGVIHRKGELFLDGQDISLLDSHHIVAAGLSVVPEGRLIFAPLSVEDNLHLGSIRLQRGRHVKAKEFDIVYNLFPRLAERRHQVSGTLSGGEQHRCGG